MTPAALTKEAISFGPFSLVLSERLLTKEGNPVVLGARALDILIALVSRPHEVISKRELLSRVWPDVTVEETSLRFHMAALRRVLGDGKDGARYITTQAGRGYCFVAPVSRGADRANVGAALVGSFPHANLPGRLMRMVGRADDILRLSTQLTATRFVTIVGAGGVGKTTVAIAVGHHLIEAFADAVLFVDLGMLNDPRLVAAAVTSMLGLVVRSDDPTPGLVAYLRDKRILLILDTCEHLIDAVADLASRIFMSAPQAHILSTSREALQVEGEHVYKLDPLACPPDDQGITASIARSFPATQLFVERAIASGARLDFNDADAAIVGNICRKLDGVALAIELAARRVEAYGLQQTAALLDQRLTLLWLGPRSAPPRQKTLHATLDWSYGLLSEPERIVLRRLAVFVGHFTLDAALAVVTSARIDQALVVGAIDSLVAKSMVATRPIGAMMRYRLLDTTRAYALEIKLDASELVEVSVRHAGYYRQWLEQTDSEWRTLLPSATERSRHLDALANVREALEWCFGPNGAIEVGIGLAAAAAPVFMSMSLLTECHRWSERAVLALDEATRGGLAEMRLQSGLGMSLMFTREHTEVTSKALEKGLLIAEKHEDLRQQMILLGSLHMFHFRRGDFKASLHYSRRSTDVAHKLGDPAAIGMAHSVLGISLEYTGDLEGGRAELEQALRDVPTSHRARTVYLGFDYVSRAAISFARILWLQGYPAQATEWVKRTVIEADRVGHPVTLTLILHCAAEVFLWTGDLMSAEEHIDWLGSRAQTYSLGPYVAVGLGLKGVAAIRRGDAATGVEHLEKSLEKLHAACYELLTTVFSIALVQGLTALKRFSEGLTLIEKAIRRVETNGDLAFMPELLRVKGELLLAVPDKHAEEAEACLTRSLEYSRAQGTRAWELRTAVLLARWWAEQGRRAEARLLLKPVFEKFNEGADTADLKTAARLLAALD